MSYLSNIARLSGTGNIGGLLSIQVIRKADVESITEPVDGVVFGDIVLKPGKAFVTWSVTVETPRAKSSSTVSREGTSKGNRLEFMIPKDRPSIKNQLEQAESDEFIILYKDANGQSKIFGLLDTPVRFEYDHDSGGAFAELNAYTCRFVYDGPNNIFQYDGEHPTSPGGASPAVVKFNGSAIASLQPGEVLNIISDFGFTAFYVTA